MLDAKQKAALSEFTQAVREHGVSAFCKATGLNRSTVTAVLSGTARHGTVLKALDFFEKAKVG